jgi:hypothetical protein
VFCTVNVYKWNVSACSCEVREGLSSVYYHILSVSRARALSQ